MNRHFFSHAAGALAVSAVLAAGAQAQKATVSDAEVQANLLRAFAGDNRLANEPITASSAFGTVTLTGAVATAEERDAADHIASTTAGVRKVVDQLRVGQDAVTTARETAAQNAQQAAQNAQQAQGNTADGSAQAAGDGSGQSEADLEAQQYGGAPVNNGTAPGSGPAGAQQAPENTQQPYAQTAPQGQDGGYQGYPQNGYPQQGYPQDGQAQGGYQGQQQGQAAGNYPPPPPSNGRLYRRDYERQMAERNGYGQGGYGQGSYGGGYGQTGGQQVTVAPGTVLSVRINRWLNSGDAQPGSGFTAIVNNDVVTAGQIAIPRGATVNGEVVDVHGAGALKGRGSLTLRLTSLKLGGQQIPLSSDTFTLDGRDKTGQTVGSTIVGGALGAIIGGAVGGGAGAAVGAGVGGVAGLGASAASNGGQAVLPAEAVLHFRLAQPVELVTLSEAELQRLGQYAGPARRPVRPGPYGYPGYPPPPGYYGRPYGYYY